MSRRPASAPSSSASSRAAASSRSRWAASISPWPIAPKHSSAVATATKDGMPIASAAARARRAHSTRAGEVGVVDRVGGELDLEVGGGERALLADLVQRPEQPRVRGGVAAEQVLAHRAARDEPRAHRRELGADQREAVAERRQRLLQPAGGGQRLRQPDQQLEPARDGLRGLGQQPQRGGEAVGGGRGRARRGVPAGLDEHLERLRRRPAARSARGDARAPPASRRARPAPPRRGRGRRSASPRRPSRRSRAARAGGGSGSGAGRRCRSSSAPASSSSSASSASSSSSAGGRRSRGRGRPGRRPPRRPARAAARPRSSAAISCSSARATARGTPPPDGSAATLRPAACWRASCCRKNGLPPPAS